MTWLEEIVKSHEEFESPKSFYFWSALTAISAVVKDNIWIDRYIYKLYPNVYTMLHAESGMKKGPPVALGRQLVKHAIGDSAIITGRSSIQGILKEMGTAHSEPGGKIVHNNATFICSSELASSIVDDPVSTQILTDLYDRNYNEGNWRSLLKMESFSLKNPTLTMLTATNEAMSQSFFKEGSAIKGGYFARTFIVHESKRNRPNSLLVPPETIINYKDAAEYLKLLVKLRGPFLPLGSRTHTEVHHLGMKDKSTGSTFYYTSAGIVYERWYEEFVEMCDEQEIRDETGTLNRFGDSVLKVALLMQLSKEPVLELHEESVINAISQCEKLIGNVRKATMGKNGTSVSSALKGLIIMELLEREPHQISRTLLMRKYWAHYSGEDEFNDVMISMVSAGMVKDRNMGNVIIYEMPSSQVEELKHLMSGKFKEK